MHKTYRAVSLVVALVLLATACGGGDEEAAETTTSTSTSTTSTTSMPTTTESTTTTTTEAPELGPVFPLTGEPLTDEDSADHPAVVVKISNNDAAARAALLGLDEADVIFEERIEQSATRFASVFHSVLPEEVGSVRSGRTSDIQIVANLNRPVFAFSGANDGVHGQLRRAEVDDGLLVRASADFADPQFRRIGSFSAPNNLVVDVAALLSKVEDGEPPLPIFDYGDNVISVGEASPGVRIDARTSASYVWSPDDGGYMRFEGSEPHVTRDGSQLTPQNVIVLTTTYVPSQIDRSSVDAITVGSGPVVVYSGGFRVEGTWTRDFPRDPYTFTASDGEEIGLAPGQTWVSLAPAGTSAELTLEEAGAFR